VRMLEQGWTAQAMQEKFQNLLLPGPAECDSVCVASPEGDLLMGVFYSDQVGTRASLADGAEALASICSALDAPVDAQSSVAGFSAEVPRSDQAQGKHSMFGLTKGYIKRSAGSCNVSDLL
jgi:hypothetical protein